MSDLVLDLALDCNEFFDLGDDKSTIQVLNNSFDKRNLDDDIDRPFTASSEEKVIIERESCPNCHRSFFKGKLQLHLKSCAPQRKKSSSVKNDACQNCGKKLLPGVIGERHRRLCMKKATEPKKALETYSRFALKSAINEEEEQDETMIMPDRELCTSQPFFLPQIQTKNILSRSVPIVPCPHCNEPFEQRNVLKHISNCPKRRFAKDQFCTNCGSKFHVMNKYCSSCGKKRK